LTNDRHCREKKQKAQNINQDGHEFACRLTTILPLLEERAGVRTDVETNSFRARQAANFWLAAPFHAAAADVSLSGQTFLTGAKSKL